jgi:hypothetical protein
MNKLEKRMLNILKQGKDEYGYLGIKSEFEAEGIRMEELHRLEELVRKADLKLGIKIGGCEAVSDLHSCKQIGADYIIAPMIETPYALSKYISAKNSVFNQEEQEDVSFLFNLETITAYNNLMQIIKTAKIGKGLDGVVFGRVDFSGSLKFSANQVTTKKLTDYCIDVAIHCKENNLEYVVGGSVDLESIDSLKEIKDVFLTRFETRKVILNSETINRNDTTYLRNAIEFELLALKNKCSYHTIIANEDLNRIKMLEERVAKFSI